VELKTRQRFNKSIVIREAKRIDICNQLANLEGLEFYVNEDGIPVLRTEPTPASGFVFFKSDSKANISDQSREFTQSERISGILVWGKDDKLLYKNYKADVVRKIGVIEEFINDSNITTTAKAKQLAKNLYYERAKDRIRRYGSNTTYY